jgi:hypothetical protein
MTPPIIDSHMHCGVQNVDQPLELIKARLAEAGIERACLFAPVEDIYDRYDPDFVDSQSWQSCRQRANEYLLDAQAGEDGVFAYYFVWNDFVADELGRGYCGIKWHRHADEPVYHYEDPSCEAFLQEVYTRKLPIVLEETFENTLAFIARVDGRTPIIIPHLGFLNGGFTALLRAGVWDNETVYADTALASRREMSTFIERYGHDKLLFGSDFPFGTPRSELRKVEELGLDDEAFAAVTSGNVLCLVAGSKE